MFETLFPNPEVAARHTSAPYAEERRCYLTYCAQQGYTQATLRLKARELLWVARKLSVYPDLQVTLEQVSAVANDWADRAPCCVRPLNPASTRQRFIAEARSWLRFLGCWRESPPTPIPFAPYLDAFATWMKQARGLSAITIQDRTWYIGHFLRWYGRQALPFADFKLHHLDTYLAHYSHHGWSRVSVSNAASALRAFLRYASLQGWCDGGLAEAIQGPRLFPQETLPSGPSWSAVSELLAKLDTDRPSDIRDRAIILFFAVYGLRSSEVAALCLEAIDWTANQLWIARPKQRDTQLYPLVPTVGHALIRYLTTVRPSRSRREVFLTRTPPFRPLSGGALHSLVRQQLRTLGVELAHYGPHALRHAGAAPLVAEGFSLKAIGDHLGHRRAAATRLYAKVDLVHLRAVAAFDLGELP